MNDTPHLTLSIVLQAGPAAVEAAKETMDTIEAWTPAIAVLVGAVVIGYLVKTIVVSRLGALFAKTKTNVDDLLLAALRKHIPIWFFLLGLAIAARFAPIEDKHQALAERVAVVGALLSLTFAIASCAGALLTRFAGHGAGASSLIRNIVKGLIIGVGALLTLQNLGVEITPIVAALGVGGLAVALGLQPTLADVFAGLHVTMSGNVHVGDFLVLDNGTRGTLLDIGWRAVRVLDASNNVVVVPNGKFAAMVVTNTQLPDGSVGATVEMGIAYGSDLTRVEQAALDVARQVQREAAGAKRDFEPLVRFTAFGPVAITMVVTMRAQAVAEQGLVVHEFMKRVKLRFEKEGFHGPTPRQIVVTESK
jgi:small-conductance mechanosensitive channel